jgi:hypothetical protein
MGFPAVELLSRRADKRSVKSPRFPKSSIRMATSLISLPSIGAPGRILDVDVAVPSPRARGAFENGGDRSCFR